MTDPVDIKIACYDPTPKDLQRLDDELTQFSLSEGGPDYSPQPIGFVAMEGDLIAGELIATDTWGRYEINFFKVNQTWRSSGVGTKLLLEGFEPYARDIKKAHGIHLWTPSWQGWGYYEKCGYKEIARLPLGHRGEFTEPQYNILYHKEFF